MRTLSVRPALALVVLLASSAAAELRLPAILGDHMVVQRDATTHVWGWADPGDDVEVTASWGKSGSTTAAPDGAWSVELETPPAGGPFTIAIRTAGVERTLTDVLSGDVWICSGQSNMEWPLWNTEHGEEDVANASRPMLRLFDVAHQVTASEQDDCAGAWSACTPESARGFSAVGYHFGARVQAALDVPIGLVGSNWGGTPAESWTSAGTLQAGFPEFHPDLATMADIASGASDVATVEEMQARFWKRHAEEEPGMTGGWMKPDLDDSEWKPAPVPGDWADFGEGGWDGCIWYRTTVDVPAAWAEQGFVLELGAIDDMDLTWINGALVGESRADGLWSTPRRYAVPAGAAKAGENVIAICAVDSGGAGRVGAEGAQRIVPSDAAGGGQGVIALDGEWRYRRGGALRTLGGWSRAGWMNPHRPSSLFNGMLAPILPHAIKGAIWYQGESNRGRHEQYRRLFPAMIFDWRQRFGVGDFPFYFVQLAPFGYGGDTGQLSMIREAQALALGLPNTGMAVTMDVGNPGDIHPRDKRTVGDRLARLALAKTYGMELACEGPTLARVERADGGAMRVVLLHAQGLTSRGEDVACFTIAGADRVFHPAQARIDGESVVVSSPEVPDPVAVRYGWGATDAGCLWNGSGLPAPSFRSDDWPE